MIDKGAVWKTLTRCQGNFKTSLVNQSTTETMEYSKDDDYIVDMDSDDDEMDNNSSDEEIDQFLTGVPKSKVPAVNRSKKEESSSEDEFEKQMNAQLDDTVKRNIQQSCASGRKPELRKTSVTSAQQKATTSASQVESACYDEVYFDSDSDDEATSAEKAKKKHKVVSNDELLYNPDEDADDQRWVDDQRRAYQPRQGNHQHSKKPRPLPNSDAVLDCPACMTTLCHDCQRHEIYKNQYRAMFVMNCKIITTEQLKFPKQVAQRSKKRGKRRSETADKTENTETASVNGNTAEDSGPENFFNPVHCSVCNTEVGVYDRDEIYHFFNVLSSY